MRGSVLRWVAGCTCSVRGSGPPGSLGLWKEVGALVSRAAAYELVQRGAR